MGIPKFFRYISERYPLTSQLIQENKIPEFDNLYIDFNGIIHNCSHPNDEDAHFRMSEEQIFTSIFAYVDHLFGKIKPKKLFFMAVDGVAPRAKMNQQRSRRFRTAKEAREVREKAERKGEKLPDSKPFDSNCITPGTSFMARLSDQLHYFVNKKITEDSNWREVTVVLSGHEVPGEGEHKIMEYIRLSRAQPDYDPNVRHCLYGLDADLIMLGLLSHDPHFCLLREEVKFGPARSKGNKSLESTNFYLLHLTLMREYLDLEFHDIEPVLPFPYSLEHVIDDFILLAVFVGNDFLPNLPDLHIHENGLEKLFDVYKKALPSLDGYINENGVINTKRLQVILDEMANWEREVFEKEYSDLNWYKGKQAKHVKEMEVARQRSKLVLTKPQREIFDQVRAFVLDHRNPASEAHLRRSRLSMPNVFAARERKFISTLAEDLHLSLTWDEFDEQDQNLVVWRFPGELEEPLPENGNGAANGLADNEDDEAWEDDEDDEESRAAVDRVLTKYAKAKVMQDDKEGDFDARYELSIKEKMDEWKRGYYRGKLEISYDDPKEMGDLIYRYVEGLQWVMHYYYSGVASWSWFYNYHYAPRISDLQGIDQMIFHFELGKPFRPFEQLMGVLPEASKELIPPAYRELMNDVNSPILDFYPTEFEQDLNGKKQEWEAIVKIPFIDEKRLLQAMHSREHRLTQEERRRNGFGASTKFTYNPGEPTEYPSSLPGFFPALHRCLCMEEVFDLPTLDGLHLIEGLCDGVYLGAKALAGFASLDTLKHTASLGHHGVNVHGSQSRNKSMVIHIENEYEGTKVQDVAQELIGKRTFVGWPFLQEGLVSALSDTLFKYEMVTIIPGHPPRVVSTPHNPQGLSYWKMKADKIEDFYSKRCGVITGNIDVLVHVKPLKGLKRLEDGALIKDYEGSDKELEQAIQMTVFDIASEDPRFVEKPPPPLSEEFPVESKVFFLGEHAYGIAAQVSETSDKEEKLSVVLAFSPSEKTEIEEFTRIVSQRSASKYFPSFKVAEMVGLSSMAIAKITSSFMVLTSNDQKHNLGLSLKFDAKGLKVIDYSKKDGRYWEFSDKAIELIKEYKGRYPEVMQILDRNGDSMTHASDIFPNDNSDVRIKEVETWLISKGVKAFEPVSLFCDQLKKETVKEIEALADKFTQNKSHGTFKKAIVKGMPRQAVLKPAHAAYRLQNQRFALGDRVTMVQDSGGVPLSVKGVVIGLNTKSMDVIWDVAFMSGTTLSNRCSQYRGSTVEFTSCLNLTNPQFVVATNGSRQPPRQPPTTPFKPRSGPYPAIQPSPGQRAASGFTPATTSQSGPVQIMTNPNRGRGGYANGRVGGQHQDSKTQSAWSQGRNINLSSPTHNAAAQSRGPYQAGNPPSRGSPPYPPRGGFPGRGRGFYQPQVERGRGGPTRGIARGRGRGRSDYAPPLPS